MDAEPEVRIQLPPAASLRTFGPVAEGACFENVMMGSHGAVGIWHCPALGRADRRPYLWGYVGALPLHEVRGSSASRNR